MTASRVETQSCMQSACLKTAARSSVMFASFVRYPSCFGQFLQISVLFNSLSAVKQPLFWVQQGPPRKVTLNLTESSMTLYLGSDRVLNADDADAGEILDDVCLILPVGLFPQPLFNRRVHCSTSIGQKFVYFSASQILLAAGQINFPRGPKIASGGPYFCLAGQVYLFTINCQSLAGHF